MGRKTAGSCAAALRAASPRARIAGRLEEDVMILVVFDPRTGERVTVEVAETAQGKRIVKRTRRRP